MNSLRVYLDYGSSELARAERRSDSSVVLPVKVLDNQGTVLAETVASSVEPAIVDLPTNQGRVFVRLTWPSGQTEIQEVSFSRAGYAEATFSDANISRDVWAAWAIPRLNQSHSPIDVRETSGEAEIDRYAKVWLRVWMFKDGRWIITPIRPNMQFRSEAARQIDMSLDCYPHLLHIGGSNVPWRFVSLPGGGPCRVLLTPNNSSDPRADPLKVVVTSFRTDAETLLEFLSRDAMRAATTIADSEAMAVKLFAEKFQDPLAAVAGGYFLLRVGNWERVPMFWWENLSSHFPWVPDTAILHCVRLLRAGLAGASDRKKALSLFQLSIDRGWPVYEEGIQLLQEASSLLKQIARSDGAAVFSQVDTLSISKTWAGAALSFYGREPSKPSAVLWVGMPQAPRRRKLATRGWSDIAEGFEAEQAAVLNKIDATSASRKLLSMSFADEFASRARLPSPPKEGGETEVERIEGDLLSGLRVAGSRGGQRAKTRSPKPKDDWILLGDIGS